MPSSATAAAATALSARTPTTTSTRSAGARNRGVADDPQPIIVEMDGMDGDPRGQAHTLAGQLLADDLAELRIQGGHGR
jgi:hypothetical protein